MSSFHGLLIAVCFQVHGFAFLQGPVPYLGPGPTDAPMVSASSLAVPSSAAAAKTALLLEQVRDLGHYPKESTGRHLSEQQLAQKMRKARKAKQFTPEQEAELVALQTQRGGTSSTQETAELIMQEVRNFGHYPKDDVGRGAAEQQLARKVRRARQANRFTPQQEAGVLPGGPKKKGC